MNWIIAFGGSNMDDVITYRVVGSIEQVKLHLLSLVKEDREAVESRSEWEHGTEEISEISEYSDGSLYAYGSYDDFHIDYKANPETEPIKL